MERLDSFVLILALPCLRRTHHKACGPVPVSSDFTQRCCQSCRVPKTDSYLLSVAVQVRTPLSVLRLPQLAADRNCEDENSHGHRQPQESSGHFQVLLAL